MKKYDTVKVFTPSQPAKLTFIERDMINDRIVDSLRTPGKQIIIYGLSGSGKSTLLLNKLDQLYEHYIVTSCLERMPYEDIILDAFDQLNIYYNSEEFNESEYGLSSSLSAEYVGIKALIQSKNFKKKISKKELIISPQLTIARLGKFLGALKACWILENFHKLTKISKNNIAQAMKVFVDLSLEYPEVKIIAIGAVGSAREVLDYESNLKNRISEILVPLMNNTELMKIICRGEKLLNIKFSKSVKENIVKYSNGLASVCHQLPLNICFHKRLYETSVERINIRIKDLELAINRFIEDESDTIKSTFDSALKQKRKQKYNNAKMVLSVLSNSNKNELSSSEIYDSIKIKNPSYPRSNLTIYLRNLIKLEFGALIQLNHNSGKYSFSSPFYKVYARARFNKLTLKKVKEDLEEFYGPLNISDHLLFNLAQLINELTNN